MSSGSSRKVERPGQPIVQFRAPDRRSTSGVSLHQVSKALSTGRREDLESAMCHARDSMNSWVNDNVMVVQICVPELSPNLSVHCMVELDNHGWPLTTAQFLDYIAKAAGPLVSGYVATDGTPVFEALRLSVIRLDGCGVYLAELHF